ncbi:hypothetical protein [Mucilaginibacter segetis]|uniref:Uncharacterized protein n=1 Tax=Mucilaginibacter segetis TaxID=2793071 RepID=A0A934PXR2_9SPHI|nr:hypothetical protein [Mucilaginibacter segetis]MBK0381080.1 hypothetical protein [Mucilaginibacter segetis]
MSKKIFKIYSENFLSTLKKYGLKLSIDGRETISPLYVCPLSLRCYEQDALISGELTQEHVPPKSLGGKVILLTDREINNKDGHTSDKKLLQFFEGQNFTANRGEISALITVGEDMSGRVSAKMSFDISSSKPRVEFATTKANINALDYKGLFKNWDGGQFHVSLTLHQDIDKRALLKIAYLTVFSKIGYELIFGKNGLRTKTYGQLINYLNGNVASENFPFVYINGHAPIGDWSVGVITMPQDLGCFVVNLTFQLKESTFKYAVFLPNPDDEGLDNLIRLSERMPLNESELNFQVGYLPFDISQISEK